MRRFLTIALALCMVFSLSACGESKETVETIDVCFASEPQTIDPALSSAADGTIILNHAFEGLVKWEDDGNGTGIIVPGMAEKWDVSEDKTTYTFHLRKDAVWSDGKPVTSQDFMYGWNRLADPATGASYSYMLDMVKGYDSTAGELTPEIEAPDDHTFIVYLDVPTVYFLEMCAFNPFFPVRQDVIEKYGDQWTFDPETYICNGPYKMKEWQHNSSIVLVKRDDYYDADNVQCAGIKFHLMDDANAILAGFKSGELDFAVTAPPDEIPELIASGQMRIKEYLGTRYISFNTQREPFDNPKVREAFSLAVDRNYICEMVQRDGSKPAGGIVPAGTLDKDGPGSDFRKTGGDYYDISKEGYKANCDRARELMAEAGYPNGEGFPVVEYLYNTNDANKAVAEAYQDMWKNELGVTVTLQNHDWNVYLSETKEGKYQIARSNWNADYNDPTTFLDMFVTGSGNNNPQYANPKYDELIGNSKSCTDDEKRFEMLHEAEDILIGQDWAVAPVFFATKTYLQAKDMEGVYIEPLGSYFLKHSVKK